MAYDARFIGPIERLLYLRTLPEFADLPAQDLGALVQRARERHFRRGQLILAEGEPVPAMYLIVEGSVAVSRKQTKSETLVGPAMAGILELFSQAPSPCEYRADSEVVSLELAADDVLDALEDHFTLFSRCLRLVATRMLEVQQVLEPRGALPRSDPAEVPYPSRELDLVQRIVMMRGVPAFARCNLDALVEIARMNVELRLGKGSVLFRENDAPDFSYNVIYGVLRCEGNDPPRVFRMGPGSIVGNLEVMAGRKRSYEAVAETDVVLLRYEWELLLDVLEDHFDVGFGMLSFLSATLLRLLDRLHHSERISRPNVTP